MLVVQSHIIGKHIQRPVIRKGLWNGHKIAGFFCALRLWVEHIVLGDKMACARMQRAGKEGARDEVYQGLTASKTQEKVIEEQLGDDIEEVNPS